MIRCEEKGLGEVNIFNLRLWNWGLCAVALNQTKLQDKQKSNERKTFMHRENSARKQYAAWSDTYSSNDYRAEVSA